MFAEVAGGDLRPYYLLYGEEEYEREIEMRKLGDGSELDGAHVLQLLDSIELAENADEHDARLKGEDSFRFLHVMDRAQKDLSDALSHSRIAGRDRKQIVKIAAQLAEHLSAIASLQRAAAQAWRSRAWPARSSSARRAVSRARPRDSSKRKRICSCTESREQPQIESWAWFWSSSCHARSRAARSERPPSASDSAAQGSAWRSSSASHSRLSSLIQVRVDQTPGRRGAMRPPTSSPSKTGRSRSDSVTTTAPVVSSPVP